MHPGIHGRGMGSDKSNAGLGQSSRGPDPWDYSIGYWGENAAA